MRSNPKQMQPIDVHFDMETNDPDDMMTLCWLTTHPLIKLRSLSVMPGSPTQLGLVKKVLKMTAHPVIPIGSWKYDHPKPCVSEFHFRWLGTADLGDSDGAGWEIIQQSATKYPDLTVLTGAPLKNFAPIATQLKLKRWVAQGGFAGDNIVPPKYRLAKFEGRLTCPTFNFNGDWKTAMSLLQNETILEKRLVSKNVCHGMIYNQEWHERVAPFKNQSAGLSLLYQGMDLYLKKGTNKGKKFHDPLAACVMVNPGICEFKEVEMYRKRGGWGANLKEGSNTFISISANVDRFFDVLLMN